MKHLLNGLSFQDENSSKPEHNNIILGIVMTILALMLWMIYSFKNIHYPMVYIVLFTTCMFLAMSDYRSEIIKSKRNRMIVLGFAALFSLMIVFRSQVVFTGNLRDKLDKNYFKAVSAVDLALGLLLLLVLSYFLNKILDIIFLVIPKLKNVGIQRSDKSINTYFFLICFFVVLFVWGIGYLSYWPGTDMWNDINAILIHGPRGESFRSPIIFNYIVYWLIIKSGLQPNLGFSIYTFLQMAVMAVAVSYVLNWLWSRGISCLIIIPVFLFYLSYPIISLYSFTMVKDTPYSICIFLWLPLLYDFIHEEKLSLRSILFYILLIIGTMVFRNNGKIVVPVTVLFASLLLKKHRKFLLCSGMVTIITVTVVLSSLTRGVPYRFAEGISIPLQQIAMVLSSDGSISEEDRQFLFTIKEEEYWTGTDSSSYAPMIVDPLKMSGNPIEINPIVLNDDYLNEHKKEFVACYLRVLAKNPKLCLKAWLMNTFGFWAFNTHNDDQAYCPGIQENAFGLFQNPKLPNSIQRYVRAFYNKMLPGSCGSSGSCFWLILFVILLFMLSGNAKYILITIPMLANWGTLIVCTPIAFAYRYVFYYLLSIPVLLIISAQIILSHPIVIKPSSEI